jgi:hypothetical protein
MKWEPDCSEEYKRAVLRARAMSPEEKILEGGRLFEEECEKMKVVIRKEMPELDEGQVDEELGRRLDQRREEEERDVYIRIPLPKEAQP